MPNKIRKSINKNKIFCVQCSLEVLESDEALQCDVCLKTLHSQCSKLDKKEYEKLVNNTSLEYKCHFCAPSRDVSVYASNLTEIKTKLNQLDEIKETIQFMSSQYDAILKGVAKNTKQIKCLKKENDTLRKEVNNLKSTVKFLNDFRVKNDCIINGIKEDEKRNAVEVVLDVAKQTGADVCEDDVEEAYFLNNAKQNKKQKQKSIVVKFTNKKNKQVFMNEKAKLKEIEGLKKVYINDFLCKESVQLLNHAKSLKEVGFSFIYARGGNVFVKKDPNSRQICVRTMDDVDKLLCKSASGTSKRNIAPDLDSSDDDDEDDQFESSN